MCLSSADIYHKWLLRNLNMAVQVGSAVKLSVGVIELFLKNKLSKQASATQPRPEKVARMCEYSYVRMYEGGHS